MKTLLKTKIVFLLIVGGVLFSCKNKDNEYPQDNPTNGSEIATDTTTTTQDNYNTDGTTVAPGQSNSNSGTDSTSTNSSSTPNSSGSTGSGTNGSGTNGSGTSGSKGSGTNGSGTGTGTSGSGTSGTGTNSQPSSSGTK